MTIYLSETNNISEVFTLSNIIIYLVMSALNTGLLLLISYKFLQIMQQSGYEGFGYFKWLRRRDNVYLSRLGILTMLSSLSFLMFNVAFAFIDSPVIFFTSFIFYALFILNYYRGEKKREKKVAIVFTSRMNRLIVAYCIVTFIFSFAIIALFSALGFYFAQNVLFVKVRYLPVCFTPICIPFLVLLAYYVMKPYENIHQKNYIKKCKQTLLEREDLIKIGITGSYGKTSVKRFLCTILQEKYNVLATPSSYNTPMGICKTVKNLKPEHQVFIAEMGARRVGDIKELAQIVNPNYAIINGIVGQHLETFGSLKAIQKTKYELVEHMENGVVAYTIDNQNTAELFKDCKIKSIPCGLQLSNSPLVCAKNINCRANGSEFELCFNSHNVKCFTKLLGEHNISNICLAAAIAHELGLSLAEISAGISRLTPIEHRLEVKQSEKNITIIDDSYNSNCKGVDAALTVLNYYDGRRIVVTPGMVELGIEEYAENYKFGKKLATKCDLVILVGRIATLIIKNGLIEMGFDPANIIQVSSLDQAKKKLNEIVRSGDVILFENDLPDKFS